MNSNSLNRLPDEILGICFSYLNKQDLYSIREVDSRCSQIAVDCIPELKEVQNQIAWLKATHVRSHVESLYSRVWLKAGEFLDKYSSAYYTISLISIPIILGFYLVRPLVQMAQAIENITKLIFFKLTETNTEIKAEKIQICKKRLIKELGFLSIGLLENAVLIPTYFFRSIVGLFSKDMRSENARIEYPSYWFRNRLFDLSLLAQDPFQFFLFHEPLWVGEKPAVVKWFMRFFSDPNLEIQSQKDAVIHNFMHFLYNVSQDTSLNKAYNLYLKYSESGYKWESKLSSCLHPGALKPYFFHDKDNKNWSAFNPTQSAVSYPQKGKKIKTIKMVMWMNNDCAHIWRLPKKEKNLIHFILKCYFKEESSNFPSENQSEKIAQGDLSGKILK